MNNIREENLKGNRLFKFPSLLLCFMIREEEIRTVYNVYLMQSVEELKENWNESALLRICRLSTPCGELVAKRQPILFN